MLARLGLSFFSFFLLVTVVSNKTKKPKKKHALEPKWQVGLMYDSDIGSEMNCSQAAPTCSSCKCGSGHGHGNRYWQYVAIELRCWWEVGSGVIVDDAGPCKRSWVWNNEKNEMSKWKRKWAFLQEQGKGSIFAKMVIFSSFSISFSSSFLKNGLKMKLKMSQKWAKNGYHEQPYWTYCSPFIYQIGKHTKNKKYILNFLIQELKYLDRSENWETMIHIYTIEKIGEWSIYCPFLHHFCIIFIILENDAEMAQK